jgi:hypothetical protein
MSKYRNQLPLLEDRFFMTDGGLETSLIFRQGVELPYFASYDLPARGRIPGQRAHDP